MTLMLFLKWLFLQRYVDFCIIHLFITIKTLLSYLGNHVPKLVLWFINDKKEKGNTSDQKSVDIYYFRYYYLYNSLSHLGGWWIYWMPFSVILYSMTHSYHLLMTTQSMDVQSVRNDWACTQTHRYVWRTVCSIVHTFCCIILKINLPI